MTQKLIEENILNTLYLIFYGTLKVDNLCSLAASHLSPVAWKQLPSLLLFEFLWFCQPAGILIMGCSFLQNTFIIIEGGNNMFLGLLMLKFALTCRPVV
jgi:hypothetical protein